MKYMQHGGFERNPFMRMTLLWSVAFLTGLWVTNFAMYFSRMGLTPESVRTYYLGSEAEFAAPRSLASMLETTHAHLPMMALVVLLLTHLVLFAPLRDRTKALLVTAGFLTAALEEGSGWLVRFAHPSLAWLKPVSFLAFQAVMGFLLASLAAFLWRARRRRSPARADELI